MIITYRNIPVEILEVTKDGAGIRWAAIRALEGRPFVGGNKWLVNTAYKTVKIADLIFEECACVLPEQSCSVCRAVARNVYGGGDKIPF